MDTRCYNLKCGGFFVHKKNKNKNKNNYYKLGL